MATVLEYLPHRKSPSGVLFGMGRFALAMVTAGCFGLVFWESGSNWGPQLLLVTDFLLNGGSRADRLYGLIAWFAVGLLLGSQVIPKRRRFFFSLLAVAMMLCCWVWLVLNRGGPVDSEMTSIPFVVCLPFMARVVFLERGRAIANA